MTDLGNLETSVTFWGGQRGPKPEPLGPLCFPKRSIWGFNIYIYMFNVYCIYIPHLNGKAKDQILRHPHDISMIYFLQL